MLQWEMGPDRCTLAQGPSGNPEGELLLTCPRREEGRAGCGEELEGSPTNLTFLALWLLCSSCDPVAGIPGERVTGRKARGLQREEIGYKCQAFFLS